jgi:benzoyl-CoA reductase subunit D
MLVCGCDVGASTVKLIVMEDSPEQVLFQHAERIRRRNPVDVVNACFHAAEAQGFKERDFAYIASTGEGDPVERRTGHFYSMTCHARGARFLLPSCLSVLDMGALHIRAIKLDARGKVVAYKMTSQCASGTGQFVENIARYLGVTLSEIPGLSLQSQNPQAPSTICAVLAETDVINLVSKGVPLPDIIRGIHDMVAQRAVKLLSAFNVESPVLLTGGMAIDGGLVHSINLRLTFEGFLLDVCSDERAIFAGAMGAALWGAFRCRKLAAS